MNKRLAKIEQKIAQGKPVTGIFVLLADSSVSEIVGYAGCDFVWIDAEHGMIDRREIYHHVLAAQAAGACAFVRVPGIEFYGVKHILDMGPDGIIFPFANTADLARTAVQASTYPSIGGKRGIGPLRAIEYGVQNEAAYLRTAADEVWRILQIESMEAVNNVDEILRVGGFQSLFIGPADLSMSMTDVDPAEKPARVREIQRSIAEKTKAAGVYLGSCAGPTKKSTDDLMALGCQWMTIGQDVRIISGALMDAIKDINGDQA